MITPREQVELLQIEVMVDEGIDLPTDIERLAEAARAACHHRNCDQGEVGIRITDDAEIQQINRSHLQHDYPTDVISFGYHYQPPRIEGELVVSLDTANRIAAEQGWSAENELILYVVHGTLHLCGMDDQSCEPRGEMRQAELDVMHRLGITDIDQHGVESPSPMTEERE